MTERAIFEAAIEITNLIKREAFLNEACAGDAALRERLEVLLASHGKASQFLNVPVVEQIQQSGDDASSQTTMMPKSDTPQAREEDDGDSERNAGPDISFLQPSSKPGSIGLLGHYEILQVLGRGAFGVVFKAFDEKLHRMVAIKVMNPALAATSPPRKRFLREARSSAAVRHENIVAIHAVEEQPVPYLVMEYIPGKTLQQWQDEHGPLDPGDILKFGQQIAAGLAAAHAQGLIHRDIKPANILLDTSIEARIKITDFGLARAVDDASMTQSGLIAGTPMYMAPEQARGQTLDHRADLFSLGTVLYTMASGRPPFRASNTIAVLKRVCEDTPRPVSEVIPGSPRWLDEIIAKLHAKEPDDRFQTAKEVSDLLARCQSELQLNGQVTCVAVPPQHDASASGRDESRPPKSSPHVPREESRTSTDANRATDNALPTMSTPRSAYFTRSVKATFAAVIGITVLAAITFKLRDNEARRMAAPGRPSDTVPNTQQTAEGGHPTNPGWHGWPADAPPPAIAPFDAEQAQQHQVAWAKYLGVPVEYTNSLGMKFRLIPPGEFTMGSTKEEIEADLTDAGANEYVKVRIRSEAPSHKVILTQPIYFGMHEVTQGQYEQIMRQNPSHFAPLGAGKDGVVGMDTTSHPVEKVSWNDATEFCAKLTEKVKLQPFYIRSGETVTMLQGTGYRLPTEAEWEFACRAGTTTKYWPGDSEEDLLRAGWFDVNSGGRTHAWGELEPNPFGLYDIHGNVWEWVQDWWGPTYYRQFQEKPAINPNGPTSFRVSAGSERVIRGGRWGHIASDCHASYRDATDPALYADDLGFRVSLTVDAVRQALKVTVPALPTRPKATVTDGSTSSTAKPLTPLPPLDLDETDPLPGWELSAGAPPPVVAPCEPTLATERQQLWAKFLKRPVIEELDVAEMARSAPREGEAPAEPRGANKGDRPKDGSAGASPSQDAPTQNATTLKFALIPPGEFRKIFTRPRDPAIEPDMPVRRFRLTKPYALSTTEVTWDQFRQFVEATGYQTEAETNGLGGRDREFKPDPKNNWRTPGWKPAPNEPVTQVTPKDAEAFCAWLTDPTSPLNLDRRAGGRQPPDNSDDKKTDDPTSPKPDAKTVRGLTPPGSPKAIYRLPTEAEWVHACRAGSVHKHVVGPEPGDLADYAWTQEFLDPNPQASPLHLVAQKKPNPFGLHDTLGNVSEWIGDFMTPVLAPILPTNDPLGSRSTGVIGDAWSSPRGQVTPDWTWSPHTGLDFNIGFRVLKQFDGEPLPGPLDRPLVLRAGQPLSVHALVPRPEKIPGLQSWSLELASSHGASNAIAVSPKGDVIATANGFGKISLWDRDGNYQRALLGHENSVTSLHFSPDGQWLASGDVPSSYKGTMGCTVRIWDVATGALHALILSPIHHTRGLKFSPDGKQLAVSTEDQYKTPFFIFDLATGRMRLPADVQRGRGLAWSPDSTKLASSATDGDSGKPSRLRIWDVATLKVLEDVECPLTNVIWSPDGAWIATRDAEAKIAIRDAKTLEVTKTLGTKAWPIAWLPDSQRLVLGQDGSPSGIFDATTGEQLTKIDAAPGAVFDEGKQSVVENHGRLVFYDTSTGQKLREGKQRAGTGGGGWSALSRDGREMFNQSFGKICVNDAATGERLRSYPQTVDPYSQSSPHPSPDGKLLGIATQNLSTMQIVDAETGVKQHELSHNKGNVTRVVWSPDGKWLATGASDKLVRVWNVATGKIEHELAGHTGTIWSLAWSPDGTRLASHAEDKTVRLWNPLTGKLVATYDQFPEAIEYFRDNELAWTTDSRRLWIALTSNIVPLDMETGTFGPLENFINGNAVDFLNTSPDGQRLLAREGAGWTFVRGRDAQDRRLLGQHLGRTAQWHPDSRRFLGWEPSYGTVGFDVETNRRLGLLFPWLTGDHWLCLGPTGHYRGSPGVEDQFVYVAMLPDGSQRTYTPAEFAAKFGWKNAPEKAELLGK